MGGLATGGGTSAVAASAHAACPRFRDTDPLLTGVSRRQLAADLGCPDPQVGIPEARWTRAMTFEAQVRSDTFASELVTKAVGQLGLARPAAVRRRHGGTVSVTEKELAQAHLAATYRDEATLITQLAVPFYGLEGNPKATPVLPDFAVVCPRPNAAGGVDGSWLIIGDAKDYERVRARIDDGRMLKGFLQVALGAESADRWTVLPDDMHVHAFGILAVPRNAFLQPEAVVEDLSDHRSEVRATAERRLEAITAGEEITDLQAYVQGLDAVFDPAACASCSLQNLCRGELRNSNDRYDVLIEVGVEPADRPALRAVVDTAGARGAPDGAAHGSGRQTSRAANVAATVSGVAVWNDRGRTDPVGEPGTVNVVVAKSDGGALALHGIAVQPVIDPDAPKPWVVRVFDTPLAATTRVSAMTLLGQAIDEVITSVGIPVHLVVPESVTADVLVSVADSLAGVELSRLRWVRDEEMSRPALNFEGEPATIPQPLGAAARLAVSFLLEEDRARAMSLRHPVVDLRKVLATHVTAGGPGVDAGRLDYLLAWATATSPLDHRAVSDEIAASTHTPGGRLTNRTSDAIHRAGDPALRGQLIEDEIAYKRGLFEQTTQLLGGLRVSPLRDVHRTLERDAQEVWQRRVALEASDLVRFSRTSQIWRNSHVDLMDADRTATVHLTALADAQAAHDMAADAGVRQVAVARVVAVDPIRLTVASRRIADGATVVALHHNLIPRVEAPGVTCLTQAGSFKFGGMSVGPLTHDEAAANGWLTWDPRVVPEVAVGDELVVADAEWFGKIFTSGQEIAVTRPSTDAQSAPKATCAPDSFESNPDEHRWCCRPHTAVEAEWSDELAARRSRGELNPQAWPPLIDEERFDSDGTPPPAATTDGPPPEVGIDDLD